MFISVKVVSPELFDLSHCLSKHVFNILMFEMQKPQQQNLLLLLPH